MADLTYKMTVTLTDDTTIDAGTFSAPQGPAGATGASALMLKAVEEGPGVPPSDVSHDASDFSRRPSAGDVFNYIYRDNAANVVYLCVGQITTVFTLGDKVTCKYDAISYVAIPSVRSVNISQV